MVELSNHQDRACPTLLSLPSSLAHFRLSAHSKITNANLQLPSCDLGLAMILAIGVLALPLLAAADQASK